jgi:hypothetical protein
VPGLSHRRVVAVLEVMWDWRAKTSSAGYAAKAPPYFHINPDNFTGKRLYDWLGPKGEFYDELLVTNACPELVNSASGRGTPDRAWLGENLKALQPFDLLLVCGRVAQSTYWPADAGRARIIECPHPAARAWTRAGLDYVTWLVQHGKADLELSFRAGRLVAHTLVPF